MHDRLVSRRIDALYQYFLVADLFRLRERFHDAVKLSEAS